MAASGAAAPFEPARTAPAGGAPSGTAAGRGAGGADPVASPPGRRGARGAKAAVSAALLVLATVLLVLFVVFNTQTVDISLVFTDIDAPLVLALAIAAVLGALIAALAGLAMRGRRRDR